MRNQGESIASESSVPRRQDEARGIWWIAVPTMLLVVLNDGFVLLEVAVRPYAGYLGVNFGSHEFLASENEIAVYLQYFLLVAVVFLLLGMLRGLVTGKADSAFSLNLRVCLTGGLISLVILLPVCIGLIGTEPALNLLIFIVTLRIFMLGFLLIAGAVLGGFGGLIGSHLLSRKRHPEEGTR